MALFDEKMTQPVILKEDSSLDEQLKQLTEFLQKPLSTDVREQVENAKKAVKIKVHKYSSRDMASLKLRQIL